MLERRGYERFGLTTNPFQGLTSDNLKDITLYHVEQPVDISLRTIKEEVLDERRKSFVTLVGSFGSGKTERLRVALDEADRVGALGAYVQLRKGASWSVAEIARALKDSADLSTFAKNVNPPAWYRGLKVLEKDLTSGYDAEAAGKAIAAALNDNAPAFLCLNDLHNLEGSDEEKDFFQTLHTVANELRPGTMVMMTAYPEYERRVQKIAPQFASRVDRVFPVKPFDDDEAALLLAKRMPAHRLVEDLDPLFPFTPGSIVAMNNVAGRNPRTLLKLADAVLEEAVRRRAYLVDEEIVAAVAADQDFHAEGDVPAVPVSAE